MILVFAELSKGKLKKTALESAAYASKMGEATAIAFGSADSGELEKLGGYGISKVIHIADEKLNAVY